MPFTRLKDFTKGEEQGKPAQSNMNPESSVTPISACVVRHEPLRGCTADFEVDERNKTYTYTLHGDCGPPIDRLNSLPIMTRRNIADHIRTSDPELRSKLAEVKRRKTPI